MKVLFIGLGSIGQRYYNLIKNNFDFNVFALRSTRPPSNPKYEYYGLLPPSKNLWNWIDVDEVKPDVAIITNPTFRHIETAIKCAERGMHLFITKPLDCKVGELNALQRIVAAKNLSSHVAYPLRHHPAVKELKQKEYSEATMDFTCHTQLSDWRSYQTYSAKYSEGGGVLLELSHEFDLATYLLGDIIEMNGGVRWDSPDTDAESAAEIVCIHEDENLSYHSLNLNSGIEQRHITVARHEDYGGVQYDLSEISDAVFVDQLEYFFSHIGQSMMNNIFEASRLFETLIKFRISVHKRRTK